MLDVKLIWEKLKKNSINEENYYLLTHQINSINFHFLWRVPESNISFGVDIQNDINIDDNFKNLSSLSLEKLQTSTNEEIIVINLLDNDLEEPFTEFIQTLINNVKEVEGADRAQEVLLDKIHKFQKLFEKGSFGKLKKNQIRGLFAELCFLDHLVDNTSPKALFNWKGPHNGLHDFVTPKYSVEVKSYLTKPKVTVFNERQLDSYITNKLFLASFHIQEDDNGVSINKKVEQLENKFNKKLKLQFLSTLNDCGYFKSQSIFYDSYLLLENSKSLHNITKDFPSNKLCNFNPEIYNIKYDIDLSMCNKWLIEFNEHLKFYEDDQSEY